MQNLPIFFVTFVPLLFFQAWFRLRLQHISFALTGNRNAMLYVLWLIFLPGVLVHEVAHWITAALVLARPQGIGLRPRFEGGYIVLGETRLGSAGILRRSLIGLAPLVAGSLVVYLLGYGAFRVAGGEALFLQGNVRGMARVIWEMLSVPQVWMWLYLIFAVANSMVPSDVDRQSWLPAALFVGFVAGLTYLVGGQEILGNIQAGLNSFVGYVGFVSLFTLIVDAPFVVLVFLLDRLTRPFQR